MNPKKIALVIYRLSKGGAERAAAHLSEYLVNQGHDVHNIIVIDDVSYSYGGVVKNLGLLKNKSNGPFNKLRRLLELRRYLKDQNFDVLIDFRFRTKLLQEYLISRFLYNCPTIYTVHSSDLTTYMPKSKISSSAIYKHVFRTVAVSDGIKEKLLQQYGFKNVVRIYNPIDIEKVKKDGEKAQSINYPYIVAVGQFDTGVKQFDVLIEAYSKSKLPENKVHLVILGEGRLLEQLVAISQELGVGELVHFLGHKEIPYPYLRKAKFLVLTSAYEGLPMVLIESLACSTPVVAFDCESGPREVIIHEQNGLLVKNQDQEDLVQSINRLFEDEELYSNCKHQAITSIEKFEIDKIGRQWLNLIEEIP